jgi:hypothetical protein
MNMTLALAHGENSDVEIHAWGKDLDILTMQAFYQAYEQAADDYYQNWWEFSSQVRSGHIVCVSIVEEDYRSVLGIELMRDRKGPYISPIFYCGRLTKKLVRELTWWLFQFMQLYKEQEGFDGYGRLYLGGRGAWQALIYRMGLYIDPEGFISEDQEGLRYGRFQRLQ